MSSRTVAGSAAGMGAAAAVSRVFGGARVLLVAAILGTTYLGNTFQGSNQFSTVLFELVAAGALGAVLVPSFVELFDAGGDERAESVAGAVLGVALLVLGGLSIVGMLASPWLARLLASGVEDPVIAAQQEDLSQFLLVFFIPQLVLYGLGAIAIALLNARRVFALPAAAPIANTVVMVGFLVAFRLVAGPDPGLDLTTGEMLLLAAAGTLGVAAFVAIPAIALERSGFRLRPRLTYGDHEVRRLLGLGGWATIQHASAALLLGAAIVVGGGVAGGVVAFQIGWFFFLAPYGILAQPIQTAVTPELVAERSRGDHDAFASSLRWALEATCVLLLPITALVVALAEPMADVVAFGQARTGDGIDLIAAALASLALGLLAYGAYLLFARTWYTLGDSRTPAIVGLSCAALGAVVMVVWGGQVDGTGRIVVLGLSHTAAFVVAAVILGIGLRLRNRRDLLTRGELVALVASLALGAAAYGLLQAWDPSTKLQSFLALGLIGGGGAALYLGMMRWLGLLRHRPGEAVAR